METNAVSLQDKIQRLIDQYTKDKAKLDKLEEENSLLREENSQLMTQIQNINDAKSGSAQRIQDLEKQVKTLENQYLELQQTLTGFETIATDAIDRIDSIIPDIVSNKK
jgi:chromosome segregation ATPase